MWLLISSHFFKNSFERSIYVLISTFFSQKSSFSHNINIFFSFLVAFQPYQVLFTKNITNFSKICTICMCRNRAGALPDFLQIFFKKMFDNGYMHPKSVLPVTYVVWNSAYGWLNLIFWRRKKLWIHKIFVIYLIIFTQDIQKSLQGVIVYVRVHRVFPSQKQWCH